MSLFHLFSKPKVERARGHGDRVDAPAPPVVPEEQLDSPIDQAPEQETHTKSDAASTLRAPSAWSFKGSWSTGFSSHSRASHRKVAPPVFKQPPRERKQHYFEPPPLFQAYPQSLMDGILEVPSSAIDPSVVGSRRGKSGSLRTQVVTGTPKRSDEEKSSTDTRQSDSTSSMHLRNASGGQVELHRKVFVLVTSGYLLQYAIAGPSDRLPEKMLNLGKDSAAFVCDRVVGRHFVLQVAEAVDHQGVAIPPSTSLLSKLGLRSSASKRFTSEFTLVMAHASDLQAWMTAVRSQIDVAGGDSANRGGTIRPKSSGANSQHHPLRKMPSQSHRYQVKRDPSRISNVSSAATTPANELPAFNLPVPTQSDSKMQMSRSLSNASEGPTIEGIEAAASRLANGDHNDASSAPLQSHKVHSHEPDTGAIEDPSMDGQDLDSYLATLTRDNSIAGPYLEDPAPDMSIAEMNKTNSLSEFDRQSSMRVAPLRLTLPTKGLKRMPSANSAVSRPHNISTSGTASPATGPSPPIEGRTAGLGAQTASAHSNSGLPLRLTSARSEPNLQLVAARSSREKRDSKMPPLPLTPDGIRPQSVLGDLVPSSTWSCTKASSRRGSDDKNTQSPATSPPAPLSRKSSLSSRKAPPQGILKHTSPPKHSSQPEGSRSSTLTASRRISSFSMPLRIIPSTTCKQSSPGLNQRSASRPNDLNSTDSSPVVHTTDAKIDELSAKDFSVSPVDSNTPATRSPPIPARGSSVQMSLFPNPAYSTVPHAVSPPASSESSPTTPSPTGFSQPHTLRRPTSLQVRADYAPFLSSNRNPSIASSLSQNYLRPSVPAPPIRGLRPSRSASNVPSLATIQQAQVTPSPPEAFKDLNFDTTPSVPEVEEPEPRSVVGSGPAFGNAWAANAIPSAPRATSRQISVRGGHNIRYSVKVRPSLSDLSFSSGHAVSFGPPAPPPSAPLPPPPQTSLPSPPLPLTPPASAPATVLKHTLLPPMEIGASPTAAKDAGPGSGAPLPSAIGIKVK